MLFRSGTPIAYIPTNGRVNLLVHSEHDEDIEVQSFAGTGGLITATVVVHDDEQGITPPSAFPISSVNPTTNLFLGIALMFGVFYFFVTFFRRKRAGGVAFA